jgi:hypothetical protein
MSERIVFSDQREFKSNPSIEMMSKAYELAFTRALQAFDECINEAPIHWKIVQEYSALISSGDVDPTSISSTMLREICKVARKYIEVSMKRSLSARDIERIAREANPTD